MNGLCVQYGSGYCAPEGWINFDASPTLRFERLPVLGGVYSKNGRRFPPSARYGDVVAGLPVASGTCRAVYASHVLEHLCRDDCRLALRETFRILQPGGIFRLVVPDLRVYASRYLGAGEDDPRACLVFMEETLLGISSRASTISDRLSRLLGKSRHLWMWDEAALRAELSATGFRDIRRAQFGDADDPMFHSVEEPHRFLDACAMHAYR